MYVESDINYDTNSVISNIRTEFETIYKVKQEYELIKTFDIKKIHEYGEYPLIYLAMLDLHKKKKLKLKFEFDLNNFKDFVNWFRRNYREINLANILKDSKYYEILYNPPEERQILHELLYDNIFISLDVIQHIECEDIIYEIFKQDNITIHLYRLKDKESIDIELVLKIVKLFKKIFNKNKEIKLIFFIGEQKKYLPEDEFICSDSVNSGLSIKNELIMIWRREEFYKVLIHELTHYYDVDFYITDNIYKILNKHFSDIIEILGVDRINESYTEIIALTIHSIVYEIIHKSKYNKDDKLTFTQIFNYEKLFSKFQVSKILNHMKLTDLSDILNNQIKQMTSVCSYYIIKYLFIEKYNLILEFWEKNGFTVLDNEDSFKKLYISIVDEHVIKKISLKNEVQIVKNNKSNSFIIKSLRMTMFQL
jgi:hypothetical protein